MGGLVYSGLENTIGSVLASVLIVVGSLLFSIAVTWKPTRDMIFGWMEKLIPRAMEVGIPMEKLYIDPLILTVSGCQEYVPEGIETVRMLKMLMDPPPMTVVGASNVVNQVPHELQSLIVRVHMVMLMAVGLDSAILDPLDTELMETIRIIEERDDSTPVGGLYLKLFDAVAGMEELQPEQVDMSDPEQVDIWKTVQVLLNKVIYTDSYLRL